MDDPMAALLAEVAAYDLYGAGTEEELQSKQVKKLEVEGFRFPQKQGSLRVPDKRLVGLVFHGFLSLYGLQNGKVAHLGPGDPFKERVLIYCNYLGRYYVELLKFMIKNIDPDINEKEVVPRSTPKRPTTSVWPPRLPKEGSTPQPTNPPKQPRAALRGLSTKILTLTDRARTFMGKKKPPTMREQLPAIRMYFPQLEQVNHLFEAFTAHGVDEELMERANAEKREFTREILTDYQSIAEEEKRSLAQLQRIYKLLRALVKKSDKHVKAYYIAALGCRLCVKERITEKFKEHAEDKLLFDFKPLILLGYRMQRAIDAFEFIMSRETYYRIAEDDAGMDYMTRMMEFLTLGHLNPFGVDRLVERFPHPKILQLIDMGRQLRADDEARALKEAQEEEEV